MPRLPIAPLLGLALCACEASPARPPAQPAAPPAAPRAAPRALPARWDRVPAWDFEQLVAQLGVGPWEPAARASLALALVPDDQRSVRAAVLLAHGEAPSAELLLRHLEAREAEPERGGDAAEVVAAAALARSADDGQRARLVALARGPRPHPDLEVRVECAVVALGLGADEVAPFLVRVLRAGTPAERDDPGDWAPQTTLAWVKLRASAALARRAGIANPFNPDASWAAQMAAADALAGAVAGAP